MTRDGRDAVRPKGRPDRPTRLGRLGRFNFSPCGQRLSGGLALILITALAYLPAFRAGFIWDDGLLITGNPLVTAAGGLRQIWFSMAAADYTPLTLTAFRLEWDLYGGDPLGYHIVNVLLHIGSALLLWRVLEKLEVRGAWLGALLFALHPVNVASVAWIAEQKNTLSLLFFSLAVLCYLSFEERRRRVLYLFAILAAAGAFLSKGSTVVLPLVLLLCAWWRRGKLGARDIAAAAPFFALAAGMAIATIKFQARYVWQSEHLPESPAFRLVRAGDAVWFYLSKDVLPFGLCPVYPKWDIHPDHPLAYLPALGIVALLSIFWIARKTWGRAWLMALGYFVVCLLPVLGFVNMGFMDQAYVADWWQQIAMIGIMALAGAGMAALWDMRDPAGKYLRPAVPCVAGVIVLALAALTWRQAAWYRSMETYSRRVLAMNPKSWSAQTNLATALQGRGAIDEAIVHLREAIRLNPLDEEAMNNLGNAVEAQGNLAEAIGLFRQALELNPADATAHCNLGRALTDQGNYGQAVAEEQEALKLNPYLADSEYNLARALTAAGNSDAAIAHYQAALRLRPSYTDAHNNLAIVYQKEGHPAEAVTEYREVLRLTPGDANVWFNLATALQAQGNPADAIAAYKKAIALQPDMVGANWNLGSMLMEGNRGSEGLPYIQTVLRLKPADAGSFDDAGTLMLKAHLYRDAADAYRKAIELQPDALAVRNRLAWLLATCPDPAVRDGAAAVDLASRANEAVGGNNPFLLHTLAAGYAASGRYLDAIHTAGKALKLASADPNLTASLLREIMIYANATPLNEP